MNIFIKLRDWRDARDQRKQENLILTITSIVETAANLLRDELVARIDAHHSEILDDMRTLRNEFEGIEIPEQITLGDVEKMIDNELEEQLPGHVKDAFEEQIKDKLVDFIDHLITNIGNVKEDL